MNKYTILHSVSDENGEEYHFISEKTYAELNDILGGWGEQGIDQNDTAFYNLCAELDINFQPHHRESLTLFDYVEPKFVDLTGIV